MTKPRHAIFAHTDPFNEESKTYCLVRDVDGTVETLLLKRDMEGKDFEEEINNLSKYFYAEIIRN
jgi:hypothetical protein